jgi:hypothetical protein
MTCRREQGRKGDIEAERPAVRVLTISSIREACTGMSAGFSPLRMQPM